jgi:hypothetical protein
MSNNVMLAFLAFAVAVVINRLLAEKALKQLSVEEKAKLLDSFSSNRVYSVVLMLVSLLVFFIASKAWPEYSVVLVWGLLIALLLMSLGNGVFSYTKLQKLSVPKPYISNFLIRCVIYYGGLSLVIFVIASEYLPR